MLSVQRWFQILKNLFIGWYLIGVLKVNIGLNKTKLLEESLFELSKIVHNNLFVLS